MKYIIMFFLIGGVSLFPQELKQNSKKESKFLELKVDNPELQIEVDEPEEDQMAILMGSEADDDNPAEEVSEENLLRALMEAQEKK